MEEKVINHFLENFANILVKKIADQMSTIILQSNDNYMNKKQTCEYLNISHNTLNKFIDKGLPEIICDGVTRYSRVEVDIWMAQHLKK